MQISYRHINSTLHLKDSIQKVQNVRHRGILFPKFEMILALQNKVDSRTFHSSINRIPQEQRLVSSLVFEVCRLHGEMYAYILYIGASQCGYQLFLLSYKSDNGTPSKYSVN